MNALFFWGEIAEFYHQHQSSFIIFLYVGLLVYLIWDLKFRWIFTGPNGPKPSRLRRLWRLTTGSGRGTGASCPLLLGPTTFAAATTSWVSRKWPKQPPKQTHIGFGIVDLLWPAFLHGVDELVWIWIWQSKGWHQEATAPSISFSFLKGKALASEPLSTLQDVIWFY